MKSSYGSHVGGNVTALLLPQKTSLNLISQKQLEHFPSSFLIIVYSQLSLLELLLFMSALWYVYLCYIFICFIF